MELGLAGRARAGHRRLEGHRPGHRGGADRGGRGRRHLRAQRDRGRGGRDAAASVGADRPRPGRRRHRPAAGQRPGGPERQRVGRPGHPGQQRRRRPPRQLRIPDRRGLARGPRHQAPRPDPLHRGALPHLRASAAPRVININSVYARYPDPAFFATTVNRAACLNLSKALARELAGDRILVNSVNIGFVATPQWENIRRRRAPT